MATSCVDNTTVNNSSTLDAVALEVLSTSGDWVSGFELLQFHSNGLVTVRSMRTGATRELPQGQWRDPVEEAVLAGCGIQG